MLTRNFFSALNQVDFRMLCSHLGQKWFDCFRKYFIVSFNISFKTTVKALFLSFLRILASSHDVYCRLSCQYHILYLEISSETWPFHNFLDQVFVHKRGLVSCNIFFLDGAYLSICQALLVF